MSFHLKEQKSDNEMHASEYWLYKTGPKIKDAYILFYKFKNVNNNNK